MLSYTGSFVLPSRRWSSDRLCSAVARLKGRLAPRVAPGDRVAIAVKDKALFMVAFGAVVRLGAVATLLASNEAVTWTQLQQRLADARPAALIADASFAAMTGEISVGDSEVVPAADDSSPLTIAFAQHHSEPCVPEAALIAYTSGSGGEPKGVIISREALRFMLATNRELSQWRSTDRFLAVLPLSHMAGLINVASALTEGVTVVASPSFVFMRNVIKTCLDQQITVSGLVPFHLTRLLRQKDFPRLDSLRLLSLSASPIISSEVKIAMEMLPQLQFIHAYGLTEAFRSTVLLSDDIPQHLPSVGHPLKGIELELRDESSVAVGPEVNQGIAWLRGPNVMMGYWDKPAATSEVMQDGWLCTSDILMRDSYHQYHVVGRTRAQLNRAGEKLSPVVIEQHILKTCPVAEVAVVGLDQGAGVSDIAAVVVWMPGEQLTLDDVRSRCIPAIHNAFLPSALVTVDTLPRTRSGKLRRHEVEEMARRHLREPAAMPRR